MSPLTGLTLMARVRKLSENGESSRKNCLPVSLPFEISGTLYYELTRDHSEDKDNSGYANGPGSNVLDHDEWDNNSNGDFLASVYQRWNTPHYVYDAAAERAREWMKEGKQTSLITSVK